MWLANSVVGRIPQFYVLVGLLFVAGGLYLGFDFEIAFYYIGFGLINFTFGVCMFMVGTPNRLTGPHVHAAISKGDEPESSEESSPDSNKPAPAEPRDQDV